MGSVVLCLLLSCYKSEHEMILYLQLTTIPETVPSVSIKVNTDSSVSFKLACYRPLGDVVNGYEFLVVITVA